MGDGANTTLTFGDVLKVMKDGGRAKRRGWKGNPMWVALHVPEVKTNKMKAPYFYACPVGGALVPWVPTHGDLLAGDWDVVDA